ncbi:MAG: pilus assembly protein TadG-related protein, partial [Acidimicrobiales bacterium]
MNRFRRNDDGFVLVVAALMLVTLMAFSALAVDLGGLYNERRQDQSGADMGALAGVRELPTTSVAAT